MKQALRNNGLSIVLFGAFFATFIFGQSVAGWKVYNADQLEHGGSPRSYPAYLLTGHFLEATTENWESEFLQMAVYVLLTVFLYQKGSVESKDPDKPNEVDQDPRRSRHRRDVPGPVRRGGYRLKLYENSLGLAFCGLFLITFALHALGGAREFSAEQLQHGGASVTALQYLATPRFWFESLQNWQSEFLAIGSMVVLSIWLRQKGSAESKPVAAPHDQTG